jgi:transaldolase/glucose-6-phosphate isomerase
VAALENAGQPVVRLMRRDLYDLGQALIQWQIATAVADSMIGTKTFDESPMEASKTAPAGRPTLEHDGIQLFADAALGTASTIGGLIRKQLDRIKAGDYFAMLAFLPIPEHEAAL